MLEVKGLEISISRGDTGSITITFTGQDIPPDGTVTLVCLNKTLDSCPIWEKKIPIENGRVTIPLYSEDTRGLSRGDYVWCLRLMYEDGDIYTPMKKPEKFIILPANGEPGDLNAE